MILLIPAEHGSTIETPLVIFLALCASIFEPLYPATLAAGWHAVSPCSVSFFLQTMLDGRCCFCHLGFLEGFRCARLQRYRGSWLQERSQTLVVSWRTVTVGNSCWVAGGRHAEHWDNLCCCSGISDHASLSACLTLCGRQYVI